MTVIWLVAGVVVGGLLALAWPAAVQRVVRPLVRLHVDRVVSKIALFFVPDWVAKPLAAVMQ